ncbi:MAG: EutN/CcmL family microcompartment protein [Gemmatimonadota bacterium]
MTAAVDAVGAAPYAPPVRFARVIGRVVSTRKVPPLRGYPLLWIEPTDARGRAAGSPLVAVDTGQYGDGEWVYFVTSREASLPLRDPFCPVDAAVVGKIDRVDLENGTVVDGAVRDARTP